MLFFVNSGVSDTGLTGSATAFMVSSCRRASNSVKLRQNKTSVGTGTETGTFTWNEIGTSSIGTFMDLGELILYNTSLSDADMDSLYDNYLKPRWTNLP